MLFFVRWPLVLVLLLLVAASLFPAAITTVVQAHLPVDLSLVQSQLEALHRTPTWLEAGLWYGAAFFFLISAIRLIRRTQAFWAWILGFACYGGRWALTQSDQPGGVVGTLQRLKADDFRPENLAAATGPSAEISLLGIILVVGLLVFVMDIFDRRFWDRQAG
ncbi:MAG: hypothetical protein ABUL73_04430 [Alphaproteobacteria bacterium]